MTANMPSAIAVAPSDHLWSESVGAAVLRGGGNLVSVEEARGLIWLSKGEANITEVLHPGIEWVQLRAAGVEQWIANKEINDSRIFTSARGVYNQAVAEHVVALLFSACRRIATCARAQTWDPVRGAGGMLRGSTVGILGAGGVGEEVIRCLEPFGVRVIAVTRSGRDVPGAANSLSASALDQFWPALDFLVISAPSTAETAAMVGAAALAALPRHAWVINVARGALLDTSALVAALKNEQIGGAALDVTDPEPLPDGHELWLLPNVIITPHVANPKSVHLARLEERIEENVRRFIAGEQLLGVVDLAAGY